MVIYADMANITKDERNKVLEITRNFLSSISDDAICQLMVIQIINDIVKGR